MEKKTKIKLEVGKSYKDSTGRIVKIIQVRDMDELPYLGDDNWTYHEDGHLTYNKEKCVHDLIEEIDMMEKINTTDDTTTTTTTDDDTTTTTNPKGLYEVKYIAAKNSEVSKLEDSLREHICGLVSIGKYQDAKELLNILIDEGKNED